jgi:Spy/CpxP family protein refolding chaperone
MKPTLLALLLGTALTVFAQGPGGGPPRGNHLETMTTLLSLNAAQHTQATTIYANASTASKTVHDSMRTAHESLSAAVKKNDVGAIETLAQQIGSYQAQLVSIQSKAEAAFYATLTPDQQTKYDTLQSTHGGPGGPQGNMMRGRAPRN